MASDVDPRLLDTAETTGMTSNQQLSIVHEILKCGYQAFKIANSLSRCISRNDTPAPSNGPLVRNLETIAEMGRVLNAKARELIKNSE